MICFTCSFLFVSGEQKQTSNGQRNLDYGGHHSIVEIHTHEQCCKLVSGHVHIGIYIFCIYVVWLTTRCWP